MKARKLRRCCPSITPGSNTRSYVPRDLERSRIDPSILGTLFDHRFDPDNRGMRTCGPAMSEI